MRRASSLLNSTGSGIWVTSFNDISTCWGCSIWHLWVQKQHYKQSTNLLVNHYTIQVTNQSYFLFHNNFGLWQSYSNSLWPMIVLLSELGIVHLSDISHKDIYGHRGWGPLRYCCFTMEPHQTRGTCQQHVWFHIGPKDHRETYCHQHKDHKDVCSSNAGNKTSLKKSWQMLKGITKKCKYRSVVQKFGSKGIILRAWNTY